MTANSYSYPFVALVGQERMKKALLLNAINPRIGGVLIRGEKGTAKSTIVRALAQILPGNNLCPQVINLPLNITEDRLIGSIDIEQAVQTGKKTVEPGLLAQANGNILYIDEVNLLDDHLVEMILDTLASGTNIIEREGISYTHPAEFILIGTMNPEEGGLNPQFLDRFGLLVEVKGLENIKERLMVMNRQQEFRDNPYCFLKEWEQETNKLKEAVKKAKELLPKVTLGKAALKLIAELSVQALVEGHRADLVMAQTALALAAFNLRQDVNLQDVKEAAELALPHRMQEDVLPENEEQSGEEGRETEQREDEPQESDGNEDPGERSFENNDEVNKKQENSRKEEIESPSSSTDSPEDIIADIGKTFAVKQLTTTPDKILRKGSGRRSLSKTQENRGRYVGSTMPRGENYDLAFAATLRAAAPYQKRRNKRGKALIVEKQDIRTKIRKKGIGHTILFVVDASGSMGAQERMTATKGAVLSLLLDAYRKRDRVGMVAFRKDRAELLLQPTKSVELAYKRLAKLPTGGRTPLAQGLTLAYEILLGELVKDPDIVPVMVLVSDGRANSADKGSDPVQSALHVAQYIRRSPIKSLVLDMESSFIPLGLARELCQTLGGEYYRIEDLQAQNLTKRVREAVY